MTRLDLRLFDGLDGIHQPNNIFATFFRIKRVQDLPNYSNSLDFLFGKVGI